MLHWIEQFFISRVYGFIKEKEENNQGSIFHQLLPLNFLQMRQF